ncbi:hypothetical protein [Microbacterium sp.]
MRLRIELTIETGQPDESRETDVYTAAELAVPMEHPTAMNPLGFRREDDE